MAWKDVTAIERALVRAMKAQRGPTFSGVDVVGDHNGNMIAKIGLTSVVKKGGEGQEDTTEVVQPLLNLSAIAEIMESDLS